MSSLLYDVKVSELAPEYTRNTGTWQDGANEFAAGEERW